MKNIHKLAHSITGVHTETIRLQDAFIDVAARFASMHGTVILMSGGDLDTSRYHILAAKPWLCLKSYKDDITITLDGHTFTCKTDPLNILKTVMGTLTTCFEKYLKPDQTDAIGPGFYGYLSYDLKDVLEILPRTSVDDLHLPDMCLFAPSILVVHDKKIDSTTLHITETGDAGAVDLNKDIEFFKKKLTDALPQSSGFKGSMDGFRSNMNKKGYMNTVKKIREYIAAGDVYQVNISQRYRMDFQGDPYALFRTLYQNNPAPFFSFINAADHFIVSTSPERFVKQTQRYVEARPIKGTRPRGKTVQEDQQLKQELLLSKKDDAELSMIVDLLRNDIGKVCEGGSVRVAEHKRIEAYQNVYHLVSVVNGVLAKSKDSIDLIKAAFPGGSITGCPKIRAMEIIDELEPNRRHIYTGAIGYIGFNHTMDMSVAIRTATIYNGKILFSVGGGIVLDSDPAQEYDETLHKGQTFMDAFKDKKNIKKNTPFVWINGKIKPADAACISVMDQGLLFGFGFFETIRIDHGNPQFLTEHIDRFYKTWELLFKQKKPDLTWEDIITQVIEKNRLTYQTAVVKILATKGQAGVPFSNTLLVTARPYTHRLNIKKKQGLHLATYPNRRMSYLADHKTLNYLFYLLAGKWAEETGADEALILNPDGSVSETNTANIMIIEDKTVILPKSLHVLPGIMQEQICKVLSAWGYAIINRVIWPDDLSGDAQVWVSNSLMGAVPVTCIDNQTKVQTSELWHKINNHLKIHRDD
jgi:para-aminobenzoate synthetase component 1